MKYVVINPTTSTCIVSHVNYYCNSLYSNLPDAQTKKLQRLINSAIRFIYNIKLSDQYSISALMQNCHFLPVKARIEYKIYLLVFKCLNNLAPSYLDELLHPKSTLSSLRIFHDKFLLEQPKLYKNNQKNRCFSQSAPDIWNKLPLLIRQTNSLSLFKKNLKTHLFSKFLEEKL